jgi:AsmA protein
MKKLIGIGGAILLCLVAALLIVPHFIDLGIFKRTYLPFVEESLRRRIDVGEVRLSLIPTPSIRLSDLKVSESPAFSDKTFFTARQLQLGLKFWPLIRGRFEVTEFVLDHPVINLLKEADGTFNYTDLAGIGVPLAKRKEGSRKARAAKAQDPTTTMPLLIPNRIRIKDGQLILQTKAQKTVKLNAIDLSLQEFSADQPFYYRVSFDYPGLKRISLEGSLSYQEEQTTLRLKDNRLKVQDLLLPLDGSVSNVATAPHFNLNLAGERVEAKPIFEVLSALGLAPSDTEAAGPMGLRISITGPSNNTVAQMRCQFQGVKIYGKRTLKGNLSGELDIKLPLGGNLPVTRVLKGEGKLMARDGELTHVGLIQKVQQAIGLIGLSQNERRQATTFKTLQAEFTVAEGFAYLKQIYLVNSQMEVNGSGTMTLERPQLDLAIDTTLSAQASARVGSAKAATFFKDGRGRIVVPLKITGPIENPSVDLDSAKLAQRGTGPALEKGVGAFFKQFFRRK